MIFESYLDLSKNYLNFEANSKKRHHEILKKSDH